MSQHGSAWPDGLTATKRDKCLRDRRMERSTNREESRRRRSDLARASKSTCCRMRPAPSAQTIDDDDQDAVRGHDREYSTGMLLRHDPIASIRRRA